MVQINFNASQYEPDTGAGADVLEAGVYTVQIVNSEVKQTKGGNGYMLVFTMSCMDPGFTGRRIIGRYNIQNQSAQAVEIAYRQLSAISHVIGVLQWQDTQQLHGRPFKISLDKVERNDKPGAFSNEIKAYMDLGGNPPNANGNGGGNSPIPSAPPAPQAPAAPPAPATAPAQTPPQAQAPFAPASAPAPAPAPDAAAGAAPWQQAAPAAAPAPAPAPQQPPAGQQPWQQPQASGATPPWAQ